MIENDEDLRLIIIAQVASAIEKSNWMFEQFYKAGKAFFTSGKAFGVAGAAELDVVIHKLSKEIQDELGLEHIIGSKIDEATTNFLGEIKTVAGKSEANYEITKRAINQGYREMYFFVEEYTDGLKNYIEEFLSKEEHEGIKIGVYKTLGRLIQKLMGIAPDLDEMQKKAEESLKETKEAIKKADEDKEFLKALEETEAELRSDIEGVEKETTGKAAEQNALDDDKIDDVFDALSDLKATTDDTNKEVKKKNDEPPIEKDQTGDT